MKYIIQEEKIKPIKILFADNTITALADFLIDYRANHKGEEE